jgi:RES domain
MPQAGTLRDSGLIDALEAKPTGKFTGNVWRVVSEGREPTQCSAPGGRWDDGTFDVLYTSLEREGALAEMHFHLLRGQPIFPSKVRYRLHELHVVMDGIMRFETLAELGALGLDLSRYGQLSYAGRAGEYPRTQEIAEVAHFLGCDGLIVPNARRACQNFVAFCDRLQSGSIAMVKDHGLVDWSAWAQH